MSGEIRVNPALLIRQSGDEKRPPLFHVKRVEIDTGSHSLARKRVDLKKTPLSIHMNESAFPVNDSAFIGSHHYYVPRETGETVLR